MNDFEIEEAIEELFYVIIAEAIRRHINIEILKEKDSYLDDD